LTRIYLLIVSLISGIYSVAMAPAARADDTVMYEVVSDDIAAADVKYSDLSGPKVLQQVPLPWRMNATVVDPRSRDAHVRADWEPVPGADIWVTVRVYFRGSLFCENTTDVGSAMCYGTALPIR
jgi:hypothetical protein